MCTVVVAVQPSEPWPVVFLGLRDESPDRPWDEPGPWWPDLGERVTGVHDREAGGAWLATARGPSRASVVLNRHETPAPPAGGWTTRGALPLRAAAGGVLPDGPQTTRTFNLLTADAGGAVHSLWDWRGQPRPPRPGPPPPPTSARPASPGPPTRWKPACRC
jgi:hypothetical protein